MSIDLNRRPRTKRRFTDADMARMRDLYYDRAVPMTRVAEAFDVPVSTFLRWIAEMEWPRRSPSGPGVGRAVYDYPVAPRAYRLARRDAGLLDSAVPDIPDMIPDLAIPDVPITHPDLIAVQNWPTPIPVALAGEVAAAARRELAALRETEGQAHTLPEREHRADVIASLADTVTRMEDREKSQAEFDALRDTIIKFVSVLRARREAPEDPMAILQRSVIARLQKHFDGLDERDRAKVSRRV